MNNIETASQREAQAEPRRIAVEPAVRVGAVQARPARTPGRSAWHGKALRWSARLGFLFFFLKGIAWLVLGWLAWVGLT